MKKLLILLLILSGCDFPSKGPLPDIRLGDRFKIAKGFYTGCTGDATDVTYTGPAPGFPTVGLDFTCIVGDNKSYFEGTFSYTDLERVKK